MNLRTAARTVVVRNLDDFQCLLNELSALDGELSPAVSVAVEAVFKKLGSAAIDRARVESNFYGRLNQKLMANRELLGNIYGQAATVGVTFNYLQKKQIAWAADTGNVNEFRRLITRFVESNPELRERLISSFEPVSHEITRALLISEALKPSKLRKAHDRQVSLDVLESSVGPLLWSLWPPAQLHKVFQPDPSRGQYTGDFMLDLRVDQPALFDRDRALVINFVDDSDIAYDTRRDTLTAWLADEYTRLNNYGFLAIILCCDNDAARAWELSADLTLFAERFVEKPLYLTYFRRAEIEAETLANVPADQKKARFDLVSEGFTYRDLFVLQRPDREIKRLVLLLQKNQRDETPVPCPACRSSSVRGNSYPSLGVKSWECQNLLCPDRSIYNRGKRYSFKALLTQAAIDHSENGIPVESVRRWQRDVLDFVSDDEIVDTVIRHYSMVRDTVVLINATSDLSIASSGRYITQARGAVQVTNEVACFWRDASFFSRYVADSPARPRSTAAKLRLADNWTVLEGDAYDLLQNLPDDFFDRAVTSPPYFNARDYAQWPNLYCYLYDMKRINEEVFRTLKPGALYAYNIFDYFDNERTISFSAMGRKRVALSSLMVDLFRRIGFEFAGTTVWDKGAIQGKRGFNAGNFSPFYQAPFNCWEHVLLLRKPSSGAARLPLQQGNHVLPIHPVVKMIRGQNVHGHTAPFPVELPSALLGGLASGSLVLDPFGGSGTTVRAAMALGLRGVMLERDPEFCALARRVLKEHEIEATFSTQSLW